MKAIVWTGLGVLAIMLIAMSVGGATEISAPGFGSCGCLLESLPTIDVAGRRQYVGDQLNDVLSLQGWKNISNRDGKILLLHRSHDPRARSGSPKFVGHEYDQYMLVILTPIGHQGTRLSFFVNEHSTGDASGAACAIRDLERYELKKAIDELQRRIGERGGLK